MIENEFDIQVRSLLQNAEESVSPQVWEGVASRLQRGRRAVVVRRYWGAFAGVALAAAAVALFVLLRPSVQSTLPVTPSQPALAQVTPEVSVQEAVPEEPVLLASPVQRPRPQAVTDSQEMAPVQLEAISSRLLAAAVNAAPEHIAPREIPVVNRSEEDQYLLNRLALEEELPARQGLSLLAAGNFQTTQRASASALTGPRFGAPPAGAGIGIYDESPEVSFGFPFSAGIGVKYAFSPEWAVGTGIRYTNLSRTFVGDYVGDGFMVLQADIDNSQHWLGVPLNLYYGLVNRGAWRVHTFVGGSCEYLLDNYYLVHNSPKDIHYHQGGEKPLQWSAAFGLGIEYQITPWLGLYLDPNFRYYFNTELQPRSLRTIQPLRFDLEIGLRFSL